MTGIIGVIGSAFVAVLTAWITARFGWDPLSTWANFIIPIGAICCGWAGSAAMAVAGRIEDREPDTGLLATFLLTGLATYPVLLLLQYRAISIDGVRLSSLISFTDYHLMKLGNASMTIGRGPDPTRLELGHGGILLQLGAAAGFIGGYALGFSALKYRYQLAHGIRAAY